MTSKRKRLTNQQNAEHSTGPKDTTRTRYNARKYGLLSEAAIIQDGDMKEDPCEFEALSEELAEDLKPVGKMQKILLDRIVSCYWRLRRAQLAEVGEIRRGAISAVTDGTQSAADQDSSYSGDVLIIDARQGHRGTYTAHGGGSSSRTTHEIAHIKEVLDLTRALVKEQGYLTEDQLAEVTKSYGHREGSAAATLAAFSSMATGGLQVNDHEKPDAGRNTRSREKCKEALLSLIDKEIAVLDKEIAALEDEANLLSERKKLERDAEALSRYLPSDEVLERILRYETTIDRHMHRALKELLELQAAQRARSDNGL